MMGYYPPNSASKESHVTWPRSPTHSSSRAGLTWRTVTQLYSFYFPQNTAYIRDIQPMGCLFLVHVRFETLTCASLVSVLSLRFTFHFQFISMTKETRFSQKSDSTIWIITDGPEKEKKQLHTFTVTVPIMHCTESDMTLPWWYLATFCPPEKTRHPWEQ